MGYLPYPSPTIPQPNPNPNSLKMLACARLVAGEGDHVELRRPGLELAHPVGRGGQRHDDQVRLRQALRTATGTTDQGMARRGLENPVASLCRLSSSSLRASWQVCRSISCKARNNHVFFDTTINPDEVCM